MAVELIIRIANIYIVVIIVRAILSWFTMDPYSPIYRLLYSITEPVLGPIRRILPFTGIDVSPLIAIILIRLLISLL